MLEFFMRGNSSGCADQQVQFRPPFFRSPSQVGGFTSDQQAAEKGGAAVGSVAGCAAWCIRPFLNAVNKAVCDNAYDPEKWSGKHSGLGNGSAGDDLILFDF